MAKENFIKICPKCGSTNIGQNSTLLGISGARLSDFCKECDYGFSTNNMFPEVLESEVENFRKQLKERK